MNNKLVGLILLIINIFIIYVRRDIVQELLTGRSWDGLDLYKLLLPLLLLITSLFLLFRKTKKNEKNNN